MGSGMAVVAVLAGVAQLASIGMALWLGGRLLGKAARSGGDPERLLGLHLVLAIGAGSLLLSVTSISRVAESAAVPPIAFGALSVAGNVCTMLGLMAMLWFNYHVFHGRSRFGLATAAIGAALMATGFLMYVTAGGVESDEPYGRSSWPYIGAMLVGDVWVISDALRFRGQLRKRLALGLADPLVVERLLLWAFASFARFCLVLIAPLSTALVPSRAERMAVAPVLLLLTSALILGATVSLWLMLAPTERYRRWVMARYAPR